VIGLASRTASSTDQQQPNANLIVFGTVRESIDRIATSIASSQGRVDGMATTQQQIARSVERMATSQEQLARSVDQLRADQEQMTREITKPQEIGQSIRSKSSESSPSALPRSTTLVAPAITGTPAARASAPKPVSPTLPEPTGP
jgi:phage shock protein A